MTNKSKAQQIVDDILNTTAAWENIFTIREMNCFVVGIPKDVSVRYNKVLSILPEPESICNGLGERWLIQSKHDRPSVLIIRYKHEYLIHVFDGKDYALFLEGIDCKKHALLHAYDLITYIIKNT